MLSFTTKPYVFEIDGEQYELPRFDFDKFERVFELMELSAKEQSVGFRDLVLEGAPEKTAKVLGKLEPSEIVSLFRDWSKLGSQTKTEVPVGEDSSSTN